MKGSIAAMKHTLKFAFAVVVTALYGWILTTLLGYLQEQWTHATMELARHNMGDLVALRANANLWGLAWWGTMIFGVALGIGFWWLLYKRLLKKLASGVGFVLLMLFLVGCIPTDRVVLVTPPNYGLIISLSNTTDQTVSNNLDDATLMNLTQQPVTMTRCAVNSPDMCPDKIIVEVQGSPESRLYTKSASSGTSVSNEALCFEAQGANGCVDFSLSAKILRNDAKCYASKMGIKPSTVTDDARFHYFATPLTSTLDTRVLQIASSLFNRVVTPISPLQLALKKFELFDGVKEDIISQVHDQTCITITNLAISNGITWDQQEIQDQINQAVVLTNQISLVEQQNNLLAKQNDAFIARALEMEKQFGLEAAIRFMQVQKWDGTYLPALPGNPAITAVPTTQSSTPATVSAPTPTKAP